MISLPFDSVSVM